MSRPGTRRSGRSSRRPRPSSPGSTPRSSTRAQAPDEIEARVEAVDRPLLAPAGTRGRPDRHQRHRPGRLRPLCRGAIPDRARRNGARCAPRSPGPGNADRPDMMATHPSTPERIAAAVAEARRIGPPGTGATGRDAYLAAIDGIAFGDDPTQGVVRGTHLHPSQARLRLRGARGLHAGKPVGGADRRRRGRSPGAAARQHRHPRFDAGRDRHRLGLDRRRQDDQCRDAADRRARSGDGDRRVASSGASASARSASNGRVYRLIFAAHTLSPAVDAGFRASLDSFRLINAQDLAAAAPEIVRIAQAGSGDTPDAMAARMTFLPRPLDQFLILNGLDRGASLAVGPALQARGAMTLRDPAPLRLRAASSPRPTIRASSGRSGNCSAPFGVELVGARRPRARRARRDGPDIRRQRRHQGEGRGRRPRACRRSPTIPASASRLCAGRRASIPPAGRAAATGDFPGAMARVEREIRARGAPKPWRAWFVSVLALAWPDGRIETFEGRVDGDLVFPPRGTSGFGYDPDLQARRPRPHFRRDDVGGEARASGRRVAGSVAPGAGVPEAGQGAAPRRLRRSAVREQGAPKMLKCPFNFSFPAVRNSFARDARTGASA